MPQPIVISLDGVGASGWAPTNRKQTPFNVGLGVVVSGGLTYTVEHTFDDVQDSSVTPTPFSNDGLTSKTTNDDGNYSFPVSAIRLNVTSFTSGSVTLTILQGS